MADNGEVLIPVNLEIDEAERQINAFARKIAKAKIDLKVNDTELEQAVQKAEELRNIKNELAKKVRTETTTEFGYFDGHWGEQTITRQVGAEAYQEAVKAFEEQEAIVTKLEQKQKKLNQDISEYERMIKALSKDNGNGYQLGENTRGGGGIGNMLKSMMRRVFVFSVITSGLRAVRTAMSSLLKSNTELQKSLGQLKGNFLTLAYPILNMLIPALNTTVRVLSILIEQIGRLVFGIFGVNWSDVQNGAQKMAKNMEKGAGSAKEIKKSLAGIDEINQLQDNSSGSSGVGSASFSTQEVTDKLLEIEAVALGAVLALGIILFMAGNIPLGLGLIAVGALGLASEMKANWDSAPQQVKNTLSKIVAIASGALLALGVLLVLSGAKVGLGIGMIVAGVAGMVSSVAINWDSTTSKIGEVIRTLTLLASGAMLVLGMLLLFSGANPAKGIALIGSAIAIGGVAFNFNYILDQLKPVVEQLKQLFASVWTSIKGAFSTSVDWMKAIGKNMMNGLREGISNAVTTVKNAVSGIWVAIKSAFGTAVDWMKAIARKMGEGIVSGFNDVKEKIKNVCTTIWSTIKSAFSNVTDWFKDKFSGAWSKVKEVFSSKGNVFEGIKDGISTTFKTIVNGLIGGINAVIAVPFNAINNALTAIKNIKIAGLTPFKDRINLITVPKIPKLAQGAVVPPNSQFLAMLGDNKTESEIVSPLSTMKQALLEALSEANFNNVVVLEGDAKTFFRVMQKEAKSYSAMTGQTAF